VDQATVRAEVSSVISSWAAAARAHDLNAQMEFYADTVSPYYKASSYSVSKIRAERQRVYALYDTLDVDITNIKISPDSSGEKAIAVFDKTWTFEGDEKFSSGSVQQQLWFTKVGTRWLITGEKDLKVYYINNK
jgi:ketosteroid isomerase-like protein